MSQLPLSTYCAEVLVEFEYTFVAISDAVFGFWAGINCSGRVNCPNEITAVGLIVLVG